MTDDQHQSTKERAKATQEAQVHHERGEAAKLGPGNAHNTI